MFRNIQSNCKRYIVKVIQEKLIGAIFFETALLGFLKRFQKGLQWFPQCFTNVNLFTARTLSRHQYLIFETF